MKQGFNRGLFWGLGIGLAVGILFQSPHLLAKKGNQIEVLFNVAQQNFYLIQKTIAYQKYLGELSIRLAQKSKVKMEEITPLTNQLQQEVFAIDLKLKELNK